MAASREERAENNHHDRDQFILETLAQDAMEDKTDNLKEYVTKACQHAKQALVGYKAKGPGIKNRNILAIAAAYNSTQFIQILFQNFHFIDDSLVYALIVAIGNKRLEIQPIIRKKFTITTVEYFAKKIYCAQIYEDISSEDLEENFIRLLESTNEQQSFTKGFFQIVANLGWKRVFEHMFNTLKEAGLPLPSASVIALEQGTNETNCPEKLAARIKETKKILFEYMFKSYHDFQTNMILLMLPFNKDRLAYVLHRLDTSNDLSYKNNLNVFLLFLMRKKRNLDLEILLKSGLNIKELPISSQSENKKTLLDIAVAKNYIDSVKILLPYYDKHDIEKSKTMLSSHDDKQGIEKTVHIKITHDIKAMLLKEIEQRNIPSPGTSTQKKKPKKHKKPTTNKQEMIKKPDEPKKENSCQPDEIKEQETTSPKLTPNNNTVPLNNNEVKITNNDPIIQPPSRETKMKKKKIVHKPVTTKTPTSGKASSANSQETGEKKGRSATLPSFYRPVKKTSEHKTNGAPITSNPEAEKTQLQPVPLKLLSAQGIIKKLYVSPHEIEKELEKEEQNNNAAEAIHLVTNTPKGSTTKIETKSPFFRTHSIEPLFPHSIFYGSSYNNGHPQLSKQDEEKLRSIFQPNR